MSTKIEDLKAIAGSACLDIYNDFSEDEVNKMSPAIQRAWRTGRDLSNTELGR